MFLKHKPCLHRAAFAEDEGLCSRNTGLIVFARAALDRDVKHARLQNGLELPYVEQGDQSGVPVLLLHGYADSWHFWEPLLPLLPSTIHCFAISERGHGDAGKPRSGYRLEDFSEDAVRFIDSVGLERAVVVGHSSGGYIARRVALDHPDRLLGLMLIGSPLSLHQRRTTFTEAVNNLRDPVDPTFIEEFLDVFPLFGPVPRSLLDATRTEMAKMPARVWQATLRGLTEADPPDSRAISVPTVVVWGDRDEFLARSEQEALAAAISGSRFVAYEGAGHLVLWDAPERIAADLVALTRTITAVIRPMSAE